MQAYENILKPRIIDDEFEGKHAIIHMKDMRQLLDAIKQGGYYSGNIGEPGSEREKWTYGESVVGRENLYRALTIGKTSDRIIRLYHKMRTEIEMKAGVSKFLGRGLSCKRKRVVRDDGDDLSMSRLMGGMDDYWNTTQRKSQRANVRIGMNIGLSCAHGESAFARLGASLAVISDVLTKMGYAVEVIVYDFTKYHGRRNWENWAISVPIKMPNEPLDIHRLMSAGLQGFFRDVIFGIMEMEYNKFYGTKGSQAETSECYKRELNLLHTVEQSMCRTTDDAVDGLMEMMQTLAEKPKWFRG